MRFLTVNNTGKKEEIDCGDHVFISKTFRFNDGSLHSQLRICKDIANQHLVPPFYLDPHIFHKRVEMKIMGRKLFFFL